MTIPHTFHRFDEPILPTAIIDGKEVIYHGTHPKLTNSAKKFYAHLEYIGEGVIHTVNGKVQTGFGPGHFWRKKPST